MTERIRKSISMQSTREMETNGTKNKHREDVVRYLCDCIGTLRGERILLDTFDSEACRNVKIIHFYCVIPSLYSLYVFNR